MASWQQQKHSVKIGTARGYKKFGSGVMLADELAYSERDGRKAWIEDYWLWNDF